MSKEEKLEVIGKKLDELKEEIADIAETFHEAVLSSPSFREKEAEEKERVKK